MRVLILVVSLFMGGCADLLILTAITIKCGPFPMGPSDCQDGNGWRFGYQKDETICPKGVSDETTEQMRCTRAVK